MPKTDLEKSHSKVSNFKLTCICLLLALGVGILFVGVAMFLKYRTYSIIGIIAGGMLSLFSLLLINKFTR